MTSRLFVLEQLKNELDKQLAAARIISKSKNSASTASPYSRDEQHAGNDEDDDDFDYNSPADMMNLREDLKDNPNECAFLSSKQTTCLTNAQAYSLLKNRTDLLRISKTIKKKLHKPNEHVCTSIDLSKCCS